MVKTLAIFDSRTKWVRPCIQAALLRGWQARQIQNLGDVLESKIEFALLFPHAHPARLLSDQKLAQLLLGRVQLITDYNQIMLYEDKRGQIKQWGKWMPRTWVCEHLEAAREVIEFIHEYPLISKADVGASSYNVRLLRDETAAINHVDEIFHKGIRVEHCDSLGTHSLQKDYVILQEFIPHEVTYRVNVIGKQRAIFYRYCYPDRPMAQTGNVKPVYALTEELESLLGWAERLLLDVQSQWVALDVLKSEQGWKLLETSLRWPWPSPGDCDNGVFFPGGKKWSQMWDVLIDELEVGAWGII